MKIKTEKQAIKNKVGTFYHPTETIYKTEKPGKTKILPSIKNKGLLEKYGYSTKLSSSKRFTALLKAAKDLSYRSVVARINLIRTLSESNKKLFEIYSKDLDNMKKWRKEHPDLYKKKQ